MLGEISPLGQLAQQLAMARKGPASCTRCLDLAGRENSRRGEEVFRGVLGSRAGHYAKEIGTLSMSSGSAAQGW